MRVLIAEDDHVSRLALELSLASWGYTVETVTDGNAALEVLRSKFAPQLAILDWVMPGLNGIEVCQKVRASRGIAPVYILLLTVMEHVDDVVQGLEAGADDYIVKPFESNELRARLRVGQRVVGLQSDLASRVKDLEGALAQIRTLSGLVPLCFGCKRVRENSGTWGDLEGYMLKHSNVEISHSICPDCLGDRFPRSSARMSARAQVAHEH